LAQAPAFNSGYAQPAVTHTARLSAIAGRRLEEARRYENLRAQEPNNADVLLGLALIAQRQGRTDEAAQLYLKALNADPRNAFAQASLSGMIARADPAAAESKLKALIAQQPAAFLHFGLGNVYAAQGRWNEAQAAYFEAQRLDPESPDYAFNLAVSLERINQPRAALDYYQRAQKLAQGKPAAFEAELVKARIHQLSVVK
jgi:tetratricopeptide (TPR) repeat protein